MPWRCDAHDLLVLVLIDALCFLCVSCVSIGEAAAEDIEVRGLIARGVAISLFNGVDMRRVDEGGRERESVCIPFVLEY